MALHERMIAAFDILESVAESVITKVADTIGRGTRADLGGGLRLWSRLQVNYSCPSAVTAPFINDLHEEGALVTLACANAAGLEVRLPAGQLCDRALPLGPFRWRLHDLPCQTNEGSDDHCAHAGAFQRTHDCG